jgi:hypothetical protein
MNLESLQFQRMGAHWKPEAFGKVGRVSPLRAAIANRRIRIVSDGAQGLSRHSQATAEVMRPTPVRLVEAFTFHSLRITLWNNSSPT